MERQAPGSVIAAVWLLRALVAWSALIALLTYVFRDDLIRTWAEGNQVAREILDTRGLDGLKDSSIDIPGYVALAVVSFVVFAALAAVLSAFFRAGHPWARAAITATVALVVFSTVAGLGRDLPPLFVGLSVVSLVLSAALVAALWRRETSAFLKLR